MRNYLSIVFLSILLFSCSQKKEEAPPQKKEEPSKVIKPPQQEVKKEIPKPDTGVYRSYFLSGAKSLSDLSKEIGESKMMLVFKINRRDLAHLKQGETIIVPNRDDSEMTYSPYPVHISGLDSVKK